MLGAGVQTPALFIYRVPMSKTEPQLIFVAQVGAAHGIQGEFRLISHMDDPASILEYNPLLDAKGNPAMAKVLGEKALNITTKETAQKSDEQLLKVIAEGSGKMPASKLNKDEQKQALGYVRTLAK